jgi:hypothetical protein
MKDDGAVSLASNRPSAAEETSAGQSAGESNAASNSSDQSIGMARQKSEHLVRLPPVQPLRLASTESPKTDEAPTRQPAREPEVGRNSPGNGVGVARGVLPAPERPSIGRRILRSVAGFLIMTLAAALTAFVVSSALQSYGDRAKDVVMTWGSLAGSSSAWQSRGDEAKRIVKEAWALSLDWLKKNSSLRVDTVAKSSTSTNEASNREAALSASVAQKSAPVAATVSFESLEQFKAMAQDLNAVRQKLEQLAAGQQQMAQKIASLQALQQDSKPKESSPLSSPAAPMPVRKNERTVVASQAPRSILRDWWISHARNGYVYVQGHGEVYRVVPGTPLPGLGAVEQIKRQNGRWVVMTPKGIIASMRDPESDEDMFDGN